MPPVIAAVGAVVGAISGAVAAVAGVVSSLGIIGSLALTAGLSLASKALHGSTDPPPARGSVTQTVIDPNAAQPYVMGQGLAGGAVAHDVAYGATLKDVPNPYRWLPIVYSGGGPTVEIIPYVDQQPIDYGYYGDKIFTNQLTGECPEVALTPHYGAAPGWTSASKLSGQAAIGWSFKFDRDGKIFSGGIPQLGAYGKWVKTYDPRMDDTFPGGLGIQRLNDESTWTWTENPALHAGTYAYGRHQNGKRTMGCGLPKDAIDWSVIAAWANVCDANGWRLFGIVYEPGDRWQNLKDIAAAGGGLPLISGGVLSFHYQAPRLSIETIVEADLYEDDMSVTAMRSYRDRINAISPLYISPDHNWEKVNADLVSVATYIADDGEVKQVEWPFNFVKDVDQAVQLARYVIEDSREFQPIEITCLPPMRALRPGDCVTLDLPSLGLATDAVIIHREIDPGTLKVKLTLVGETPGKHAFALGQTGTPPPAPALGMTGAERDDILWGAARVPALTGNRVPFSQFEAGVDPWSIGTVAGGITAYSLNTGSFAGLREIFFTGTASGSGQQASIKSPAFPVTALEYLAVSLGLQSVGPCTGQPVIWWKNAAGANISPTNLPAVPASTSYNTSFEQIVQAPAGAVSAYLEYYLTSTGSGVILGSIVRPSVTAATPGQNGFPEFAAGPNAYDAATVGAPSGTNVAGRAATEVASTISSGGGVAANQVVTASIQGNQVTNTTAAYTSGAITVPLSAVTPTTVQTISFTATGAPCKIDFSATTFLLSPVSGSTDFVIVELLRGTTQLFVTLPMATLTAAMWASSVVDTPAAGAVTYKLNIYQYAGSATVTASNRSLAALETKR